MNKQVTKGKPQHELEEKVGTAVQQFLSQQIGENITFVNTQIIDQMVVVRLKGGLCAAEKMLSRNHEGKKLLTELKSRLMTEVKTVLEQIVRNTAEIEITGSYASYDPDREEHIILFACDDTAKMPPENM